MGNSLSVPCDYPLGYIPKKKKKKKTFKLDGLKKRTLIFFFNSTWPQYKLEGREFWPKNGKP